MALHTRILLGLVLGAIAGVGMNLAAGRELTDRLVAIADPIGRVWLNALIMVVIPLVLATIAVGVAGLGSLRRVGRIGALSLANFLFLTAVAGVIGLIAVNLVRPGDGLDPEVTKRLMTAYSGQSADAMGFAERALGVDFFVRIVPRNPIQAMANGDLLSIIFFAIAIGVALTMIAPEKAKPLVDVLESVGLVTIAIINLVMQLAPLGVFALIFNVTARFGLDILASLAWYVGTVIGSLAILQWGLYPLLIRFVARRPALEFFQKTRLVVLTAFSTSSSSATLPTTLRVTREELGVRPEVAAFVVPLGATMNMNGSAIFQGVTVVFLAQVFGIYLTWSAQVIVVVMAVITAIGAAGVPGGVIPLLMAVLGMVGVPMEAIAIVLGVDRLLDMCRTAMNVTGDMVTAVIVDRFEGPGPVGSGDPAPAA